MTHLQSMARAEPERFDALERVGFKVERYGDIAKVLYVTMGGHYMDVGCSAKIAEGLVGHLSDSPFFPVLNFRLQSAESYRIRSKSSPTQHQLTIQPPVSPLAMVPN